MLIAPGLGKYCFLPAVAYGTIINITGFEVQSQLYFNCHLGYRAPDGYLSVCTNDGQWIPRPHCQFEQNIHAILVYNYTVVHHLFERAPRMVPGPIRISLVKATPRCYAKSFPYGHFLQQSYADGTVGTFVCNDGFKAAEVHPVCTSGSWNTAPYCNAIDYCASNPCENGTCVELTGGYTCNCFAGFRLTASSEGFTCTGIFFFFILFYIL
ncbi:unnamed protein product [Gongylonema pulchrum]|uniref:Sushi domain-containing protein n=1 Tax=Gongylonema pulchrum TaxID=637853 RepID=A0A183CXL5_9BILA|nr:unnamed protein product [Gongylonema pulchrum]